MTATRGQTGLFAYLVDDLRADLAAGASRTLEVAPGGTAWLGRWALIAALIGATLLFFCGYQAGFERVNGLAAQTPPSVWQWLTMLGDERVAFALALLFARRHPRVLWALILAALVASAYTHALKPLFAAPRPPAVLEPGSFNLIGPAHRKGSFPSGHTVTASDFFVVWVYFLRRAGLRWLLVGLAVLAGLSRVALGVHWPVDVAAGMAGGVLSAWEGVLLARRTPWGVLDPAGHLAFVTLAGFFAVALLISDGGYPAAAPLQTALGTAAIASAVVLYVVGPLIRWGRGAA